ncbi:MAG: hypothetical protein NTY65_05195 [Planctomycetota bacterium]|nr:hypothetical protein [Planctomycetota bacterium]
MPEVLKESQYAEWDAFVQTAKGGTIFHMSWYLRALADDLRIHVLRDATGTIEAGMAVTPQRFLGTLAVHRPPWTPYNGPLIRPSAKTHPYGKMSDEKKLMVRLLAESPTFGMYDYILPPEWTDLMPFIWNGFDTSVGYTYQTPPAPVDQWMSAMDRGHRKDLRNAHKAKEELGGGVEVNGNVAEFYGLVTDLARARGYKVACGQDRFVQWFEVMRGRDAATLYVFRDGDGQALVGTIGCHDRAALYAIVPGTRGGRLTGPGAYLQRLLLERMILDAHARGLVFDFSGSVLTGVEPYFRGWGGRCVPKYRVVKIHTPWTYAAWVLHRYWTGHRKTTWFHDE